MVKAELEFRDLQIASPRAARERGHPLALSIREMILGKHHALTADVYLNSPTNGFVTFKVRFP